MKLLLGFKRDSRLSVIGQFDGNRFIRPHDQRNDERLHQESTTIKTVQYFNNEEGNRYFEISKHNFIKTYRCLISETQISTYLN